LLLGKDRPVWINWTRLFSALEQTWLFLHPGERNTRLLKAWIIDSLAASGLKVVIGD